MGAERGGFPAAVRMPASAVEPAAMARYGAGVVVETTGEILGETLRLLTSPAHRRRMVEAARAAHRPHSARSAAELILSGLS